MAVADRVAIAFADLAAGICGIAIEGAGTALSSPAGVFGFPGVEPRPRAGGRYELDDPAGLALEAGPAQVRGRAAGVPVEGEAAVFAIDAAAVPARALAMFLGGVTVILDAARPAGARGHGEERVRSQIVEGDPPSGLAVADARLSTTYDRAGLVRHAGLELWEGDDAEYARRAAGEAREHAEIAGAGATVRVAFLHCHGDGGRHGPGVYAIVTPVS